MGKKSPREWALRPKIKSILLAFAAPKTPKQAEKELSIRKLKTPPFIAKGLLECLNPNARKGRLYIATPKARVLLQLPGARKGSRNDWRIIGSIMASPKQKLVIFLTVDEQKKTSEEIRLKAFSINPHLSRISTKEILNALVEGKIIGTEIIGRKRFYWLNALGIKIKAQVISLTQAYSFNKTQIANSSIGNDSR